MKWRPITFIFIIAFLGSAAISVAVLSIHTMFTNPLSADEQSILRDFLKKNIPDLVLDSMWNNILRYTTFFESLDGFTTANATLGDSGIVFELPGSAGGEAFIQKASLFQPFLSFRAKSFFRTAIYAESGVGTLTNTKSKIVVGEANYSGSDFTTTDKSYGFKLVGSSIYGIAGNGTAESSVLLATLSEGVTYNLSAKFFPMDKVIFYIDGIEKGIVTSNLPTSGDSAESYLFTIDFVNGEAVGGKGFDLSIFDYIQNRTKLYSQ